MPDRLKNRVAIVTGAGRGIGRAIVECLAESGAKVVLADIDGLTGAATQNELAEMGHQVRFVEADTSKSADVERIIETALSEFGGLDIACMNAGIFPETNLADTSENEWDQVCAVNLKGPFLVAKACLPHMQAARYGRMVLTSSITGPNVSAPGHGHYAATKAGLLGFMRTAALEWAPWDITINAVQPGNILTEGMIGHRNQDFIDSQKASVPLGRLGTPREIGLAVRFLASGEAAYITGQTIIVDGGQTLPESVGAIVPRTI